MGADYGDSGVPGDPLYIVFDLTFRLPLFTPDVPNVALTFKSINVKGKYHERKRRTLRKVLSGERKKVNVGNIYSVGAGQSSGHRLVQSGLHRLLRTPGNTYIIKKYLYVS